MTDRPLIVLSLDGLAAASLGCYGCSWNETPAIDAIAASGCVWDRCVATSDDPLVVLGQLAGSESVAWTEAWKSRGSVQLITDVPSIPDRLPGSFFDRVDAIPSADPEPSEVPAAEMEETQWGQLIAAAMERHSENEEWSVLWLHSDFLTRRWDAPRDLFPIDDVDQWDELGEDVSPGLVDSQGHQAESLPLIFDAVVPPKLKIPDRPHPDLVTSWMRTYGCQIRLLDLLVEVLLTSLATADPLVVLFGTSGFRLGEGGWIGYRQGPLRSPDIHLPLIVSDTSPLRIPQLTASSAIAKSLRKLFTSRGGNRLDAEVWSQAEDIAPVETKSARAESVLTTTRWFYVRDNDSSEHLYLKPDDIADFNDVGRIRDDVIQQLGQQKNDPAGHGDQQGH